jgi:hypothetical protein
MWLGLRSMAKSLAAAYRCHSDQAVGISCKQRQRAISKVASSKAERRNGVAEKGKYRLQSQMSSGSFRSPFSLTLTQHIAVTRVS